MQGGAVDLVQRSNPLLAKKDKKKIDIRLVGLNGVVGKAFFGDQIADEERSCGYKLRGNGLAGKGQRCAAGFCTKRGLSAWGTICSRRH